MNVSQLLMTAQLIHLGDWTLSRHNFIWFYQPSSGQIFQRHSHNRVKIWRRVTRRGQIGNNPIFAYFTHGIAIPSNSYPAIIVHKNNNRIKLTGWSRISHHPSSPPTYVNSPSIAWITDHVSILMDDLIIDLQNSIINNTSKTVSDGSYIKEHGLGTAGWIILTESNATIRCSCPCPGDKDVQCSYRSELMDILSVIIYINDFCQSYHINQGSMTLGCENEGAVSASILPLFPPSLPTKRQHFDLITSIHEAIKRSPITWTFIHVSGHQDDIKEWHELSTWENSM